MEINNSCSFILFFIFAGLGTLIYFVSKKKISEKIRKIDESIEKKILKSQLLSAQILSETENKVHLLKKETENDLNQRRKIIINLEEKIIHKEELLTSRFKYLHEKEESLYNKEQKININKKYLEELQNKIEKIIIQQQNKLEQISSLTRIEAREIILKQVRDDSYQEIINYEKEQEKEYKFKIKNKAKNLLILTMQKLSKEVVYEHNISMIFLEQDSLKGRIIGKEGRNIKAFEIITGVDLIIDDNPNTIILSCFDPIRREIAKRTLEALIIDGRITPASIEKIFLKNPKKLMSLYKK